MNQFITKLVPCLLAAGLCGCSGVRHWWNNDFLIGPNYVPPEVGVASDWLDSGHPSISIETDELTHWWQVFDDPVLDQLVLSAYQRNRSLRIAGLRVLEARRQRNIAATNLLPQSQRSLGRYTRTQLSQTTATSSPFVPTAFSDWQTGFDLNWEIDVWGRLRRAIESADAALDAEAENYDAVLVTLIGDVAATYIDLRAFEERIRLARENVKQQAGSLRVAQDQRTEGAVSELDVQQANGNLADTQALIPSLQLQRRRALNQLAILIGTTPYELEPLLSASDGLPTAPQDVVVGIPADLLRRRPDVRQAERLIATQSAQIGIAEADLYPQFLINGEIKLNSGDFADLFSSKSVAGNVGPGFAWNILNYGRIVNNIAVQELRFEQRVTAYEEIVLNAHREVEDAMVLFLRSKEEVAELQKAVDATARSVELVRIQYEEGETDFGRVFVLESNLVRAQDRLVAAQANVAIGLTQLYKALGGGWQLRCELPYHDFAPLPPIAEGFGAIYGADSWEEVAPGKELDRPMILPIAKTVQLSPPDD
ncbi:MAG: TolC family protein [Pirellulales bacterium]|nr:TolC family protein [Pirellulales bacterium]